MRLLVDENLSWRLVKRLNEDGHDCIHVDELGLTGASDEDIWRAAKQGNYAILSRDTDFLGLLERFGAPPKVIVYIAGNATTPAVQAALLVRAEAIEGFLDDPALSALFLDGLEVSSR